MKTFMLQIMCCALALVALPGAATLYPSSVVGTEFDFIQHNDPSLFSCLEYVGLGPQEMPDKTTDAELFQQAFSFNAHFTDGTLVNIAVAAAFSTPQQAEQEARRYTARLGKLPTTLRAGVNRLVVHAGEVDATAFSDVGLIVVYAANTSLRIATHDLEETLFHESVHASLDQTHATAPGWLAAQQADNRFVTRYAKNNPQREDLAESTLFAYTALHHPDRFPAADRQQIQDAIPARINYVRSLLPPDQPVFHQLRKAHQCVAPGSGDSTETAESVKASKRQEPDTTEPGFFTSLWLWLTDN